MAITARAGSRAGSLSAQAPGTTVGDILIGDAPTPAVMRDTALWDVARQLGADLWVVARQAGMESWRTARQEAPAEGIAADPAVDVAKN